MQVVVYSRVFQVVHPSNALFLRPSILSKWPRLRGLVEQLHAEALQQRGLRGVQVPRAEHPRAPARDRHLGEEGPPGERQARPIRSILQDTSDAHARISHYLSTKIRGDVLTSNGDH